MTRAGVAPLGPDGAWVRRRCLLLGHWTALVSLTAWLIAGIAYPICMALALGGMPWSVVVHFLASDYSSFITGQVWGVNGGQEM